jgi:hypothetical protein
MESVRAPVSAKKTADKTLVELHQIASSANLEKSNRGTVQQVALYDMQDINRLFRFSTHTINKVEQSQNKNMLGLKAQIDATNIELDYYRKLDHTNPAHRANSFLDEGAPERIQTFFDDKKNLIFSSLLFKSVWQKAQIQKYKPSSMKLLI